MSTSKRKWLKDPVMGVHGGDSYELEPVRVLPFIWHVARQDNRRGIQEHGLLPIKGLLFANNLDHELMKMWPVRFRYDIPYCHVSSDVDTIRLYDQYAMGCGFDFWRIDTKKANVKWYVDPILAEEYWGWGLDTMYHYVVTPKPVGLDALELFVFDPEVELCPTVRAADGVAHVAYNRLPLRKIPKLSTDIWD
jgi:hypothetical protein